MDVIFASFYLDFNIVRYWVDDFAEVQRKHQDEDKEEMINIAERHAKAAEAEARSEKPGEAE